LIEYGRADDFEIVHVNTGAIALAVMPGLGAKISSLRDLRTGREWLWRNPRIPYKRVPHGSSYITEADTGGWDECFPSVSECEYPSPPWKGARIQDHGELWSHAPTFEIEEENDAVTLSAQWEGIALPYLFTRKLWVGAGMARLRVDYAVTNTGDSPVQWIWSAHPLMAIERGMELRVPPGARFNLGGALPTDLISQERDLRFPMTVHNPVIARNAMHSIAAISPLPPPSAAMAMKLWSDPLDEGWATLRASDGEFRLRWDAAQLPQLGIWMNLGAWAGDGGTPYYNLGLEPCIGAQDSLADAVTRYHLFETLPPGGARSWWLEVELGE
jgi:hypothetical protein